MPFRRDNSPYYYIWLRLPTVRTPRLSTKTKNKRTAEAMERMVQELGQNALTDSHAAELLELLVSRQISLPELYQAHKLQRTGDLVVGDPLIKDAVEDFLQSTSDRQLTFGARELADKAGSQRLSWLKSPVNITRVCERSEREGRMRNSVRRRLLRAVSMILRRNYGNAVRNEVFADVNFPAEDDSRDVFLSPVEIARVLEACHGQFRTMVLTAIVTGADRGVLCRLKRRDVKVFAEPDRYTAEVYLNDTKAGGRKRTMTVVEEAAEKLYELIALKKPGERVFDDIKYEQVDYLWKSARREAGLENVRFKDLRHTFAVLCDSAGLSPAFVKTGMGHKQLSTTTRYLNRRTSFSADQAIKLTDVLRRVG